MPTPKLRIVDPPHDPAVFEISEGGSTLGRGSECTFVIAAKSVSRVHARFERRGATLSLEDLGSRNGTRVNGGAVSGVVELHPGDRIRFGAVETLLESEEEELGETVLAGEPETVLATPPPTLEIPSKGAAPAATPPPPPLAPAATPPPRPPAPATAPPAPAVPPAPSPTTIAPKPVVEDPAAATRVSTGAPRPSAAPPVERSGATATNTMERPTPSDAKSPSVVELALIAIVAYAIVVGAGLLLR